MGTYHIIYITTKIQDRKNRKKDEEYRSFEKCANAKKYIEINRMAGKVKEFISENCIEEVWHGENFNGYGYSTRIGEYLLTPTKAKELKAIIEGKKVEQSKRMKTEDEKIESWAKRLAKLTGISIENATKIAIEKINAKTEQRNALIDRDFTRGASRKRHSLIRQIERSNPLRYIRDKEHAMAILAASYRHNCTDYDEILKENRVAAQMGDIDYEDVRTNARAEVASEVSAGVIAMTESII